VLGWYENDYLKLRKDFLMQKIDDMVTKNHFFLTENSPGTA